MRLRINSMTIILIVGLILMTELVFAKEIFNKKFPITLRDEEGIVKQQELTVIADLDSEKTTLRLSILTKNYDRKKWLKKESNLPFVKKYTSINHSHTAIYVLHPQDVSVLKSKQKAYLVPQHKYEDLKPFEETPKAQLVIKGGELFVDYLLMKTGIPFAGEMLDQFIDYSAKKTEKNRREIFNKINKEYTATRVPLYLVDRFVGFTVTGRVVEIPLDLGEIDGEVPVCLWAKIAVGDPSVSSHGSSPMGYGEINDLAIHFSLTSSGKNMKTISLGSLGKKKIIFTVMHRASRSLYISNLDGTESKLLASAHPEMNLFGQRKSK